MKQEIHVVRMLAPIVGWYPWVFAAIVLLGVFSSLTEGLGIGLFIPLLNTLDKTGPETATGQWLLDWLSALFRDVSQENRIQVIAGFIILSVIIRVIVSYVSGVLCSWLDARVGHRLRSDVFDQLLTISYHYLERTKTGTLLNTLASETWHTGQAFSVLIGAVTTCCTFTVYAVFLLLLSWQLTLIVGFAMMLISIIARVFSRHVKRLGDRATAANSILADRMLEGFWGMKLIRAFGRETYEKGRFDHASEDVSRTFFRMGIVAGAVGPLHDVLAMTLIAGTLAYMQPETSDNLAQIFVFIFLLYRLQPTMKAVDDSRMRLLSLSGGVEAVTAFLNRSDKPYTISGRLPFRGLTHGISFSSVTFRYDPDSGPALNQVSFLIPVHKTTALVGPSGAGKSTLINLLFRFYDAQQGVISVDSTPLRDLDLGSWRDRLALVSQDSYVLSASIRENIAYGKFGVTQEEIVEAAQKAQAHDFIAKLPQGYDSQVGNRGVLLSGGQIQRITLARAIIRNPDILILDEATNQLDSIAEHLVQEALAEFSHQKTVIVIAHRLSTIEQADHIAVLDAGELREQGTMRDLLQLNGLFAKLYKLQHRDFLR